MGKYKDIEFDLLIASDTSDTHDTTTRIEKHQENGMNYEMICQTNKAMEEKFVVDSSRLPAEIL